MNSLKTFFLCLFLSSSFCAQLIAQEKAKEKKNSKSTLVIKEELFLQSLQLLDEISLIIETAKDEESIDKAITLLDASLKKAKELKKASDQAGMDSISSIERQKLEKKHKARIQKTSLRLLNAIQLAKSNKKLNDAFDKIIKSI